MLFRWKELSIFGLLMCYYNSVIAEVIDFSKERRIFYRDKVKSMFYHAYNGYLNHAYPLDELRPLTCTGMDTWGSFSLTLVDALDTLVIMGNHTEFARAVDLVLKNVRVDANVNVSVFETNIRVVGGLLSAHMLSGQISGYPLHAGWPCAGPLLDLAERFAARLLPAFNTATGMPYGTVNLRYGVNVQETPITCTACVGSFILEFGTLSRLTGNPHYERVALRALKALWESRSAIGLVGNHINVQTGGWTATDAGIGAGVDSYFEYLLKGALFFQRPLLMHQFYEYEKAINQYIRKDDWFVWVSMTKGQVTLPIFQSLEAFWPGILALVGKVEDASRIIFNYNQVVRQYGLPPEFYNLPNREAHSTRSGYPLRPEFVESLLYLYKATEDPNYLKIAARFVEAIERTSKTRCGYATIREVGDFTLEDRMESFFLSETTKYLYLIFDDENFIHNDGADARVVETTDGSCVIDAGGYIFNTEAHPLDPGIVYCCGAKRQNDTEMLRRFEENVDFLSLIDLHNLYTPEVDRHLEESDLDVETTELGAEEKELSTLTEAEQSLLDREYDDNQSEISSSGLQDELSSAEQDLIQPQPPPSLETSSGVTADVDGNSNIASKEEADDLQSNSADSSDEAQKMSTKIFARLGAEFNGLLDASEKIRAVIREAAGNLVDANDGAAMRELLKKVLRPFSLKGEPFVQALCDDCCVPLDRFQEESLALRRMASAIYGKHIGDERQSQADGVANIRFVQGPVCREKTENSQNRREHKAPLQRYKNTPPDFESLESERQNDDAVTTYSFSTFAYRKLATERYSLLSAPPRPFSSNFVGAGQIVPAA